jgi:hypothetical protein
VSRRDPDRLQDILDAIEAINGHVARGDLSDGLIFDAVGVRLIEIGEAIKATSPELLDTEPGQPWTECQRRLKIEQVATKSHPMATARVGAGGRPGRSPGRVSSLTR